MPYSFIDEFKGGVDRRRPIYALKPGTLWECQNAHLTTGGDIEKRKAFVSQGSFSSNTFGLFQQGDELYTFGSDDPGSAVIVPSNVTYQQLQHPEGVPMVGFLDADLFDGKIYVIALFADGTVMHFYDGVLVQDWSEGIVFATMGSLSVMAATLAAIIAVQPEYTASVAGQIITVTAATAGVPFTATTFAQNGGAVDDQAFSSTVTTPNVSPVTAAFASIGFSVSGGTGAGTLASLKINGTEVLSGPAAWVTDNTAFAAAICALVVGYTATNVGPDITIKASATGSTPNGYAVEATTTGTARAGDQAAAGTITLGILSGGVTAVAAVAQVVNLELGGTFDPGDRFGVTLVSGASGTTQTTAYVGNTAKPYGNAACVKTHKRKMYAGALEILFFSGVNTATQWNSDTIPGAGFLVIANHAGGSESVLSLETYQGRLAAFSRRAIQLWTMQNDDTLNALDQTLENTGTRSPRSTLEYGGNDVFYLDDSGIRSLKARDASNNAFVSGVGAPINKFVRQWMRDGASQAEIEGAVSAMEPEDARFWMAIGTRIFVYSFFPEVGISAWSWYDPGFTVTDFARTTNRMWCRGDNNVLYLYGGASNEEYDTSEVRVQIPFTSAGKPGTFKNFSGMDIAATGTWACKWKIDPNDLFQEVQMGSYNGVTFPKANWAGVGHTTHIAPLFTHSLAEYASLSQVALFYQGAEEST